MLSFLRGVSPPRRNTAHLKTITYEDGKSSQTFYGPSEEYFVQHYIPDTKSFLNPPPHIHFYQDETFLVEQGAGIWHRPTAAPAAQQSPRTAGQTITFPPGTYHHFQNAADEPLVVRFKVDPKLDSVHAESFFRNFFGYLDDCRAAKMEPSPFQLQLFMKQVEAGFAIPVPGPDSVKWYVSWAMMLIMGPFIGGLLLGYKASYEEYYSGKDTE